MRDGAGGDVGSARSLHKLGTTHYRMERLRFAKIRRPSLTPSTMVEKSSSSRSMLAASFETSEPEMFIAIPRSAFLSAGASLTPSPVTPTMCPSAWACLTISSLCFGLVRAKTTSVLEKLTPCQ